MIAACLRQLMVLTTSLTTIHPSSGWVGAIAGYLSLISFKEYTNFESTLTTAIVPIYIYILRHDFRAISCKKIEKNQCCTLNYNKIILRDILKHTHTFLHTERLFLHILINVIDGILGDQSCGILGGLHVSQL